MQEHILDGSESKNSAYAEWDSCKFPFCCRKSHEHIIRVSNVYFYTHSVEMLQDDSPVKRKRCFVNSIPLQVTWMWYRRLLPLTTKELFSLFTNFYPVSCFFFSLLSGAGAFMGMVWLALTNISHLEKNILINLPAESF